MTATHKMTTAAFLLALGILLPMAFHAIPNAGSIFAPMHLPVLLAGFICGPFYGALLGLLTPLMSFLFTGMPPVSVLPGMMVELFAYGLVSGLLYRLIKTKHLLLDVYLSLVIAMLVGRTLGGLTNWCLYLAGRGAKAYTWATFFTAYFVVSWPAILIQVIAVPSILMALLKAHLIPESDRFLSPEKETRKEGQKQEQYFDALAPEWGKDEEPSPEMIKSLLEETGIKRNERVLDLACGKGVLTEELLTRGAFVTGLDVSGKMIEKARETHKDKPVRFIEGDFYQYDEKVLYDAIVCFNAYPHFLDRDGFVDKAASLLKKGGRLYIIHSMGREKLNEVHGDMACGRKLLPVKKEAFPFWRKFRNGRLEEDENHYFVELIRR